MAKQQRQNPKKPKATPNTVERPGQPLAPAPRNVLFGVVVFAMIGFWLAARFRNDYVAVAVCTVVMVAAWMVLEFAGRAEARQHPNPLYVPNRLPLPDGRTRTVVTVLTVLGLMAFIAATARPDARPSAFPFFVAAGFLFLILPQLLARRQVKRASKPSRPIE